MSKVLRNVQSNAWRWLVGAVVATLVTFSYFLPVHYYLWHQPGLFSHHQYLTKQTTDGRPAAAGRRLILLYWTSFFESKDFGVGTGSKPFSRCDDIIASGCLTTTDRGLLNDSDAVIFHGRDLNVQDLPPPGWRRPHQIFVFFLLESPVHTNLGLLQQPVFRHYFNRTMTYRRDSDVLNPYGRLLCGGGGGHSADADYSDCVDLPQPADSSEDETINTAVIISTDEADGRRTPVVSSSSSITPSSSSSSARPKFRDRRRLMLAAKNRTIAWFVSNCQTNSQRESLVRRLSELIAVDIYGRCAASINSNGHQQQHNHSCANRAECDRMLSRHYRFYLSFENSLCPDYVTEKLYRPLAHDTVPVVYGGADYSLYLPAGSYVDARDFQSPEALADHLKRLMADDTLYLSYFDWRDRYAAVRPQPAGEWCPLCRFLLRQQQQAHQQSASSTAAAAESKTYEDVAAWWSGQTTNRTCTAPPASLVHS